MQYRALLVEYRALLFEDRALLVVYYFIWYITYSLATTADHHIRMYTHIHKYIHTHIHISESFLYILVYNLYYLPPHYQSFRLHRRPPLLHSRTQRLPPQVQGGEEGGGGGGGRHISFPLTLPLSLFLSLPLLRCHRRQPQGSARTRTPRPL